MEYFVRYADSNHSGSTSSSYIFRLRVDITHPYSSLIVTKGAYYEVVVGGAVALRIPAKWKSLQELKILSVGDFIVGVVVFVAVVRLLSARSVVLEVLEFAEISEKKFLAF